MKRFLLAGLLGVAAANATAQDANYAALINAQRDAEEREQRYTAQIENLQQANTIQQRRINELINEIGSLRRQLAELDSRFKNSQIGAINAQDLKKAYDKMAEMERARDADKKLILEQIEKVKEIASKPAPQIVVTPPPARPEPRTERRPEPLPAAPETKPDVEPPQDFTGDYYPYTVKKGDYLSKIITAYNAELKEKGKAPITLDMVKKANPKMNPNNLTVGKEIRIPVPPDKK